MSEISAKRRLEISLQVGRNSIVGVEGYLRRITRPVKDAHDDGLVVREAEVYAVIAEDR
jgi:hypothetical protein